MQNHASAPQVCLAGRSEKRQYSRQFGSHPGNHGLFGWGGWFLFILEQRAQTSLDRRDTIYVWCVISLDWSIVMALGSLIHVGRGETIVPGGKIWVWGVFWGWGVAGVLGGGVGAGLFTFLTATPDVVLLWTTEAALIGAGSGLICGSGGVVLSHWFDEPIMRWTGRSAILFGTVVTLLLFSLIAFPLLPYFSEHPQKLYWFDGIVAGIASFIAAASSGVISNLVRAYDNRSSL